MYMVNVVRKANEPGLVVKNCVLVPVAVSMVTLLLAPYSDCQG